MINAMSMQFDYAYDDVSRSLCRLGAARRPLWHAPAMKALKVGRCDDAFDS
jgi:hypothetical protein